MGNNPFPKTISSPIEAHENNKKHQITNGLLLNSSITDFSRNSVQHSVENIKVPVYWNINWEILDTWFRITPSQNNSRTFFSKIKNKQSSGPVSKNNEVPKKCSLFFET